MLLQKEIETRRPRRSEATALTLYGAKAIIVPRQII